MVMGRMARAMLGSCCVGMKRMRLRINPICHMILSIINGVSGVRKDCFSEHTSITIEQICQSFSTNLKNVNNDIRNVSWLNATEFLVVYDPSVS